MKTKQKELYNAPLTRVFGVETECIICISGDVDATMDGTWVEEDA